MAQDTRKDPRAKVLTMTVRYKSATLDEFIENHSHDVSRGGMFIKTPSPFSPGTLLKFEVRIAGEQRLMQGVGRVVWRREPTEAAVERPAGMGIKFIKLDDKSRQVIESLVQKRRNGESAYDQGEKTPVSTPAPKPSQLEAGGKAGQTSKAPEGDRKAVEEAPTQMMFPKTDPLMEMPAPEDRTVMRQAAVLLQDALREAGGSIEDFEEPGAKKDVAKPPAKEPEKREPEKKAAAASKPEKEAKPERTEDKKRPQEKKPTDDKKAQQETRAKQEKKAPAPEPARPRPDARHLPSKPPATSRAPISARPSSQAPGSGGGRPIAILVGLGVVVGLVFFLTRREAPEEQAPAPTEEMRPATDEEIEQRAPTPPEPAAPEPAASAAAVDAAVQDAAPKAAAPEPEPPAAPEPKVTAPPEPPKVAAPKPVAPKPRAAPRAVPRVARPAAKPTAPAAAEPPEPEAPAATETPAAQPEPPAAPAAPAQPSAPAEEPKPEPEPKPAPPSVDINNPY